jgi:NAD(P)-dependent dehydrogenase (short-subunit alcohol dehydrogenase family)
MKTLQYSSYSTQSQKEKNMPDHIFAKSEINTDTLFDLTGKVAIVTGGSRGIGLMIAQGYVERGVKVYISSRKADVCDAVAAELCTLGECVSMPADISTPEGCQQLADDFAAKEDKLDILVNNAGATWGADFDDYPDAGFSKIMELNVRSIFSLTRNLAKQLKAAGTPADPSRVINIGSMDGLHVNNVSHTGTFAYAASKAAVHHLTRTLAVELAPRNITVNAIAPGFFESKMTEYVFDNYIDDIKENSPLKRIGKPEEMAGLAIYLASRAGAYTNGTVIAVDGGTCIA